METFGQRLHCLRKQNNYKVASMAKEIGISIQAWTDYEKDRTLPQVDKLILIARYFKVSVDFLLFGNEIVFYPPSIDDLYSSYLYSLNELMRAGLLIPKDNLTIRDNVVFESNDEYVKMFVLSYLKLKHCTAQSFNDDEIFDMSKALSERFKFKVK